MVIQRTADIQRHASGRRQNRLAAAIVQAAGLDGNIASGDGSGIGEAGGMNVQRAGAQAAGIDQALAQLGAQRAADIDAAVIGPVDSCQAEIAAALQLAVVDQVAAGADAEVAVGLQLGAGGVDKVALQLQRQVLPGQQAAGIGQRQGIDGEIALAVDAAAAVIQALRFQLPVAVAGDLAAIGQLAGDGQPAVAGAQCQHFAACVAQAAAVQLQRLAGLQQAAAVVQTTGVQRQRAVAA
ncbi:hypothetical protein VL02_09350 [Chromobacterium violaceum]|nr:hypothetical protein VK93_18025 [Chromobacterium violaceum]KMN86433.1 hypothetical protein VL02_09350 [Chromobacterium violaceum]